MHCGTGIDRRQLADRGRVVRQVQPGPEADLQDLTLRAGEDLSPTPRHTRPVQDEIAKARKDRAAIETHGFLLGGVSLVECTPDDRPTLHGSRPVTSSDPARERLLIGITSL